MGRKNLNKKAEDESQLILNSPSSDGDGNSILNGNTVGEVGFVFPNVKLKKTPVSQVSWSSLSLIQIACSECETCIVN